ncbi:MAG: PD-(D/E)XK nuclease family protein [Synergistaceae bacterium]|jgi:S-DNA-T family DNA segregation ATPase FtsK/SpoIIIE|nr:PD-(D/E)XK nuclease family protein [Synergistaceae bacterium]
MRKTKTLLKTTATALHICQRCPRLMAYQVKGEKGAWQVGLAGAGVPYGKLFHEYIAGKFHFEAADGSNRAALDETLQSGGAELETRIGALIRERYFVPFLAEKSRKLKCGQLTAMARAAAFWVKCLADFLLDIPSLLSEPEKTLSAVFHQPEKTLYAVHTFSDGVVLEVQGRYDGLLFNPDKTEAALFEFKGFKSSDVTVELSQTLVYAWLIFKKTGIVPSVRLIYLEDDAPLFYSAADVKNMFDNLPALFGVARGVLENAHPLPRAADSLLCRSCPYQARCEVDWGGEPGAQPQQPSLEKEKNAQDEGQQLMDRLLKTLSDRGLSVEGQGWVCGPSFIRLKIIPDMGKTPVYKIENKNMGKDLQVALALPAPPLIKTQGGHLSVDVARVNRQKLFLEDLLKTGERPDSDAAFPLGLNIDGKTFWADLTNPNMTSVLIGGTSGSGKSVLLRSIVMGLLLCAPRDGVSLTLIDPKRVTFTDMRALRCLEEGDVLPDTDEAMEALGRAVEEMERRYVLLEKAGTPDIAAYNGAGAERLKRRVLIIDEYADMMIGSKSRESLEHSVQRICQKGRAAGIHLILATQRPDATVVTGIIKANLQLRVALKVTSQVNSQIILGEGVGEARHLLGFGDMFVGGSVALERLQAPLDSPGLLDAGYFRADGSR